MSETYVKLPPDHPKPLPVSILFGDEALEWKADFCRMRNAVQGLDSAVTSIGHSLAGIVTELREIRGDNIRANESLHSISKSLEQITNIYRTGR